MIVGLITAVALGCSMQPIAPSMCFKEHVRVYAGHFEPEVTRMFEVARETAPMLERGIVWITSANDSAHVIGSLHFHNKAIDIRIKNIVGHMWTEAREWAERIQAELGPDYDVILAIDHIHIEHDPKGD